VTRRQKAELRGVDWAFAAEQLDSGMMYCWQRRLSFRLPVATTKSCAYGEDCIMEPVAVAVAVAERHSRHGSEAISSHGQL
jgi:hypothetical protein